jgi:hypothetical protein
MEMVSLLGELEVIAQKSNALRGRHSAAMSACDWNNVNNIQAQISELDVRRERLRAKVARVSRHT